MRLVLSCALLALLVSVACAAPGSYFSKEDAATFKSLINAQNTQGVFGSTSDNVAAIDALKLLGSTIKDTTKLCANAKQGMLYG